MSLGQGSLAVAPLGGGGDTTSSATGTLATTLAGATLAAAGTETISGTLATTLADATLVASGNETIDGTLAATLAGATLVASGAERFDGTLTVTLDGATLDATGIVGSGALVVTLEGATLSASGVETISGTLSVALDGAALVAAGNSHIPFRDVTVEAVTDLSQIVTPADLSQIIKPVDASRTVVVSLIPEGGTMKLPPEGREWYVIQFTTTPQVGSLIASFDSEATWVDGELVSGSDDTFRWLVAGPDFDPADPDVVDADYTEIPAAVTPMLRSYDAPEVIQRKGKAIALVQS